MTAVSKWSEDDRQLIIAHRPSHFYARAQFVRAEEQLMTYRNCTRILLASVALSLVACGSGGGQVNSTPTPAPSPTPTPTPTATAIIKQATTSQEFAVKGATGSSSAPADQLRVRYDAAAKAYEVQLPSSGTWERLLSNGGTLRSDSIAQLNVQQGSSTGYEYSALAEVLFRDGQLGAVAFGIPTPAGAVPTTGNATFKGSIFGQTNETFFNGLFMETVPGNILGDIDLGFDFGAGTLSGSISPVLYLGDVYNLPSLQFTNTVYSAGSTTFSGKFDSALSGANSFSGLFTGPAAQELLGSLAFPYTSPVDSKNYQAAGAFVAKRH
jgi:hypothetical protein